MSDQQFNDEHIIVAPFIPPTNSAWDILHPVTIFQVLQAGDSLITEGKEFTSVAFVAHVISVEISAAEASFILEDGTGRIYAHKEYASLTHQRGLSAEAEEEEISQCQAFEHAYVEVMATLKKNDSRWKPRIKINSICLVHGYHQVMYHILHVIHSHMLSQQSLQPYDSDQDFGSSEDTENMPVDDGQANQNNTSIQHHITCAIPALCPILPNTFSPQKHQPYATLKPLERAIMKYVHRNQPVLIADLAQAIEESPGCTESQFDLVVQSLLSEAYITSLLDDGYVVVTPRH